MKGSDPKALALVLCKVFLGLKDPGNLDEHPVRKASVSIVHQSIDTKNHTRDIILRAHCGILLSTLQQLCHFISTIKMFKVQKLRTLHYIRYTFTKHFVGLDFLILDQQMMK